MNVQYNVCLYLCQVVIRLFVVFLKDNRFIFDLSLFSLLLPHDHIASRYVFYCLYFEGTTVFTLTQKHNSG